MPRKDDPYYDRKVYHYAAKFALNGSGDVSALCYKRPRRINLKRGQSWTIRAEAVTCRRCKQALKDSPPTNFPPKRQPPPPPEGS